MQSVEKPMQTPINFVDVQITIEVTAWSGKLCDGDQIAETLDLSTI